MDASSALEIAHLPDELLLATFRLVRGDHRHGNHCARTLLRLAGVCTRWRMFSKDWSLWENVFPHAPFPRTRVLNFHAHGFPAGLKIGTLGAPYASDTVNNRRLGEGARGPMARQVLGRLSRYVDEAGESRCVRLTHLQVLHKPSVERGDTLEGYDANLLADVTSYMVLISVKDDGRALFPIFLASKLTSLTLCGWPAAAEPFLAATTCLRILSLLEVDETAHLLRILQCVPPTVTDLQLGVTFSARRDARLPLDSLPRLPHVTHFSLTAHGSSAFPSAWLECFGNHVTPHVTNLHLGWSDGGMATPPGVVVPRLACFAHVCDLFVDRSNNGMSEVELKELPLNTLVRLQLNGFRRLRAPPGLDVRCVIIHAGITYEGWTQKETFPTAEDWHAWLSGIPLSATMVIFEGVPLLDADGSRLDPAVHVPAMSEAAGVAALGWRVRSTTVFWAAVETMAQVIGDTADVAFVRLDCALA